MSEIDINLFSPSPWNFNKSSDEELEELAHSIQAEGVRIPIKYRVIGKRYEIVDEEQKITACKDILKLQYIPSHWTEQVHMSDDEVRQYIRNSLTRSKNKDLMREAHHYYTDKERKGMSLTEYAESVGKSISEMSRILTRVNTPRSVQDFISQTTLPASVVDEVLKVKPQYALEYLKEAEDNQWNTTKARERMSGDRTVDGGSVVENPKTKPYDEELKRMDMDTRVAISKMLEDIIIKYAKMSKYLNSNGYSELSEYMYGDSVKTVTKMKNLFEGVHNIIPRDPTKPIYRVNLVRDYVKKDIKQTMFKAENVVKKINRTPT